MGIDGIYCNDIKSEMGISNYIAHLDTFSMIFVCIYIYICTENEAGPGSQKFHGLPFSPQIASLGVCPDFRHTHMSFVSCVCFLVIRWVYTVIRVKAKLFAGH